MTCREFVEFIADYLAEDLPSETRRRFEHHLAVCENCQRYLATYRASVGLGRRAFDDEDAALPGDVPEDLVRAVLLARRRPPRD